MSVILLGDGTNTSSIAIGVYTFSHVALSPDRHRDNVDVIEGDGGYTVCYEKGTFIRIFPYRFTLLSDVQKKEFENKVWKTLKGRLHWFTLQPHNQPVTDILEQEYAGGSTLYIKNSLLAGDQIWVGWWVIVLTGAAAGQKRKVISSDFSGVLQVSPAFDNTVAVGDTFVLGYPVMFQEPDMGANPRIPNFWDMNITFVEKIM